MSNEIFAERVIESPVGRLLLRVHQAKLTHLLFAGRRRVGIRATGRESDGAILDRAERQLEEYFTGRRRSFDLPLAPSGTQFQTAVWRALETIPWGAVTSYGEIARRIDRPTAARAVGAANGRNPISIIVPCHRVIGADGSLTGYGGGLEAKKRLLAIEGRD